MASDRKGFWQSTAGVVTGIAGVITGGGAIVGALAGTGVIGGGSSATTSMPGPSMAVTTARGSSGGGSSGSGAGKLSVSTRSLNFGSLVGPLGHKTQDITVSNTGSAPLDGIRVSITGDDKDDFEAKDVSCGDGQLRPDADCKVEVTFAPSSKPKDSSATLVVRADDADPAEVSLRGATLLG